MAKRIEKYEKLTCEQQKMVSDNYKLVYLTMSRYFPTFKPDDVDYDDMVQSGFFGLLLAARNFKQEYGFEFTTYAVSSIRKRIMRYLDLEKGWQVHYRKNAKATYSHENVYSYDYDVEIDGESLSLKNTIPHKENGFDEVETKIELRKSFEKASKKRGLQIYELLCKNLEDTEISKIIGIKKQYVNFVKKKAKKIYEKRMK